MSHSTSISNKEQRQYLKALRRFLKVSKTAFATTLSTEAEVALFEPAFNLKSARAEANDTTLGERIGLARDFAAMSNHTLALRFGVSSQQVKQWCGNTAQPASLQHLAEFLSVPLPWLADGGEALLPADSHLGRRVGQEKANAIEQLYGQTTLILASLPDEVSDHDATEAIVTQVFNCLPMAKAARRAGGLWLWHQGELAFHAWYSTDEGDGGKRNGAITIINTLRQARMGGGAASTAPSQDNAADDI